MREELLLTYLAILYIIYVCVCLINPYMGEVGA